MLTINIAKEFSRTPGARYREEGNFSGQEFREKHLLPKVIESLNKNERLLVDLDGSSGYGSGFLEESFGGLIRMEMVPYEQVMNLIEFKCEDEPIIIEDIKGYMSDADEHSSL